MSSPRLEPWLIPGDDQLGLEALDQAEVREPHAVDRRAVGRVADGPVVEVDLLHPQRPPGGDRARHRRAVAVGRDHRQLDRRDAAKRAPQRLQAGGLDPVVVGQQHSHLHACYGARRRPTAASSAIRGRARRGTRTDRGPNGELFHRSGRGRPHMRLRPPGCGIVRQLCAKSKSNIRPEAAELVNGCRRAPAAVVPDPDEIQPVRAARSAPRPTAGGRAAAAEVLDRARAAADLEHRPDQHPVHVAHERVGLDPELEQSRRRAASGRRARRARSARARSRSA